MTSPPGLAASAALVMRLVKTWRSSAGKAATETGFGISVETVDVQFAQPPFHEQKNLLQHLLEVNVDGRFGFAIEAEHGPADLRDARQFLLGHIHELASTLPSYAPLRMR